MPIVEAKGTAGLRNRCPRCNRKLEQPRAGFFQCGNCGFEGSIDDIKAELERRS